MAKKRDLTSKGFEEALKRQEAAGDKITEIQRQMLNHLKSLEIEAVKQTALIKEQTALSTHANEHLVKNSDLDKAMQAVQTYESIKTEHDEDSIKKILKTGLLDKAGVGLNANILNLTKTINKLKVGSGAYQNGNDPVKNEKLLDKLSGQKEYRSTASQKLKGMSSDVSDFFTARGFADKALNIKRGSGGFVSNMLDANEAAGKKAQARVLTGEEGSYKQFKQDAKREQELIRILSDLNRSIAKTKKEGNLTDAQVAELPDSKKRLNLIPEFKKVNAKDPSEDLTENQMEADEAEKEFRKEELDILTKIEKDLSGKKKEGDSGGGGDNMLASALTAGLLLITAAIAKITDYFSPMGKDKDGKPLVIPKEDVKNNHEQMSVPQKVFKAIESVEHKVIGVVAPNFARQLEFDTTARDTKHFKEKPRVLPNNEDGTPSLGKHLKKSLNLFGWGAPTRTGTNKPITSVGGTIINKGDILDQPTIDDVQAHPDKYPNWIQEAITKQIGDKTTATPNTIPAVNIKPPKNNIADKSKQLDEDRNKPMGTPVVIPPVNVTNQTNNNSTNNSIITLPVRNPDNSINKYIQSRYGMSA